MPIHKSLTTERRKVASDYQISQWSNKANNMSLYKKLANQSDSDMMKSDNLAFKPMEMIGGTGHSAESFDHSYMRTQQIQMQPLYMYAAGFVVFLVALKYLSK